MSYWREPSGWAPLSQIGGEKYDLTPHSQLSTLLQLCIQIIAIAMGDKTETFASCIKALKEWNIFAYLREMYQRM